MADAPYEPLAEEELAEEVPSEIIRAVSSADVLRWHGYQLRRPRGDPSTYALSQATQEIDGFSYRTAGGIRVSSSTWHCATTTTM